MQQAFFTQIKNITDNDISESITTVKDSCNTTTCSIQHFVQGYSPKLPKNTPQHSENAKSVSFKKTTNRAAVRNVRSKSPWKTQQNKTNATKTWDTCLKSNMIHSSNCQQKGDHISGICRHNHKSTTKNGAAIEKVNSCPIKYTSCTDSEGHICRKIQNRKMAAMRSMDLTENSYQVQRQCGTEQIVVQLKGEIEKLREHLEHIATSNDKKQEEMMQENAKQLQQIRSENRSLKRELESKRKLLTASMLEVDKARDILGEYERKVNVLHEQTMKSSKLMKQSKDKFCKCLKDKEQVIKELRQSNCDLMKNLEEKDMQYQDLNKTFASLQGLIFENNEQFSVLSANNNNFSNVIKTLEKQLENSQNECEHYKEEFKKLEQKFDGHRCAMCEKLETKVRKQKEKYDSRIKALEEKEQSAQNEISQMIEKLKNSEKSFEKVNMLETRCNNLKAQIVEYEKFAQNYKKLEEEYNEQYQRAMENEAKFEIDRHELRSLVEELTNVVKVNKVTLLQLSQMNKEQEAMLKSQSTLISEKDRQIECATSEIEVLQKKSYQLEQEIEALRQVINGPSCSRETCLSVSRELEELRSTLSAERDTVLLKEQIIKDQTQTITSLQQHIKEKISELNRAKDESSMAEKEIMKINDHLIRKNREVERQVDEKEHLIKKLKKLEHQKSILSNEMLELEKLLNTYSNSHNCNEQQQSIVLELKREVAQQRHEWEIQKQRMSEEKDKAVNAARFATQKLLDTVADFQRQVETQKRVQFTLTKMLYEKEEELRLVHHKMSSINSIANSSDKDYPLDELYRSKGVISNNGTTASSQFFSSCSNCCSNNNQQKGNSNNIYSSTQKSELQHLFNMLTRTNYEEQPIRDG